VIAPSLVQPVRGMFRRPRLVLRPSLRRRVARQIPGDAELWRALAVGFVLALLAGAMMAMALGDAGGAAPMAAHGRAAAATFVPSM